ncbi:MAG: carbamoyltransferase HypF, partial [Dehalococcoidia bacterium]|nr:carbamoyltransferase HypF [Dehalococcoidia bacterium]
IKGLGGFQLACDATNEKSVEQLRLRKNRPSKPFAVMLCNLNNVHYYCDFGKTEELLLTSPQSPIVLLKLRDQNALAFGVAPNLKYLGVMLPYTPLHHLLIKEAGCPLIMTSGNISNEPIAADNTEACTRLNGIADYFLCHNRDIYVRYDDSVAMCVNEQPSLIRRARGYAPFPLKLPFKPSRSILGCGAEMKGTFCLLRDEHAFLSQHIGDMESIETLHHFENTLATYARMFRIEPQVIACDAHPDYLSTNLAHRIVERNPVLELHSVQHHHAHVAACMAENGVNEPVIGIAFDGTGYGSDGNIWGGEFLLADYRSSQRLAHLEYMPLPGGDAATRHPLRIALSYIYTLLGPDALLTSGLTKRFSQSELELLCRQIDRRLNSPLTSSAGRLFDAVSALLGICCEVNYEGQAAIELEMAATDIINPSKRYSLDTGVENGSKIFGLSSLFNAILKDIVAGIDKTVIAACFHASLADFIAMESRKMAHECGVRSVALCGGVFQNRLLLGYTTEALQNSGLTVLVHKQVPANDGGIALGQAAVAAYKYSE